MAMAMAMAASTASSSSSCLLHSQLASVRFSSSSPFLCSCPLPEPSKARFYIAPSCRTMAARASISKVLTQEELKKMAADKAVEYVESGMVLGLGTGSIAAFVVAKIGQLLKGMQEGKLINIVGVPTSKEGCKGLLYMVLHARVVLDLWERPEQEITFKPVEGDFDSFQGNWMLNQFGSQHTVLKYTVDTKIRKDCILGESTVEEVKYEDLPSNLCATRDSVESLATDSISSAICLLEASNEASLAESEQAAFTCGCPESSELKEAGSPVECVIDSESSTHKKSPKDLGLKLVKRRTRFKELMNDFRVLEGEIRGFIAAYGTEGIMPLRRHMRRHGRIDLEKAITAMGGFRTVAMRMKLSLAYKERKPVGYWDEVRNLRNEVISAQKEIGGDPTVLPSRLSIEKLGLYSLARALEKWGGTKETAKILGLKTTRVQNKEQRSKNSSAKQDGGSVQKPLLVGMATPLDTKKEEKQLTRDSNKEPPQNALDPLSSNQLKHKKMPFKTDVPQESSKWLTLFTDAAQPGITDD